MADRDIFCCKCGKYVGVVRDAKLAKGLKFLCQSCNEIKPTSETSPFYDFLKAFDKGSGKN